MHRLVLRAIISSLEPRLKGRRVRQAGLLSEQELGLAINDPDGRLTLIFSVRPGAPHLRLVEEKPRFRRSLTEQLGGAADLLAGSKIEAIEPLGWEPLLLLRLAPHPNATDQRRRSMLLEIVPRTPYLTLCVGDPPEILAAVRAPGTHRPDRRAMERGALYTPPFGIDLAPLLADPRAAALGPLLAIPWKPAAWPGNAAAIIRSTTAGEIEAVIRGATSAAEAAARLLDFTGPLRVRRADTGVPVLEPATEAGGDDDATPLAILDQWLQRLDAAEMEIRARRALHGYLKRERKRLATSRRRVDRDREEAGRAAAVRRQAETLVAQLHLVKPRQQRVRLPDLYGEGMVEIELDPRLTPAAMADALYRRAKRLERRGAYLEQRHAALETTATELLAIEQQLGETAPASVIRLARELIEQGQLDAGALSATTGGEKSVDSRLPYRTMVIEGKWEIWIGRSNADNDRLTHRLAATHDWWLHAYGASGAHVILRRPAGHRGAPPRKILERAAAIAAYHSRARHSRQVAVQVTEQRYVRKPRGSPPGTAVALREKTLMVEPWKPDGSRRDVAS